MPGIVVVTPDTAAGRTAIPIGVFVGVPFLDRVPVGVPPLDRVPVGVPPRVLVGVPPLDRVPVGVA